MYVSNSPTLCTRETWGLISASSRTLINPGRDTDPRLAVCEADTLTTKQSRRGYPHAHIRLSVCPGMCLWISSVQKTRTVHPRYFFLKTMHAWVCGPTYRIIEIITDYILQKRTSGNSYRHGQLRLPAKCTTAFTVGTV